MAKERISGGGTDLPSQVLSGGAQVLSGGALVAVLASILLTLLAFSFMAPTWALADPADIEEAKSEAEALRQAVENTNYELEVAVEGYNGAKYKLGETEAALEKNTTLLERAQGDLAGLEERFNSRVNSIYRDGQMGFLEAIFTARSFSELINRFDLVMRIGQSDADMLAQVTDYRDKVQATKEQLAQDQQTQTALLAEAESYRNRVESLLAEREKLLAGKEAEVERLIQEEEERQRKLAEARAAQEAAADGQSGGGGSSGGRPSNYTAPPSSSGGGSAVDIAMAYLGVPYLWNGMSPGGFDCSGLVAYVYRQMGVSLPHHAASQYSYGTYVSRDDLEPGDLVFFGSSLHHVGIYIGGGQMIHAPQTGDVVKISNAFRSDYYGARRVL